jgi:BlaI family penicillinase repressor
VSGKKRPEKPSVELTEAEWAIMRAVWKHQPCAAGTVQEALAASRGWAYSTVKTTMDRMVQKGLLTVKPIRNLQLFSAAISEKEARRGELRKMLRRAFDGALGPLLQFLVEDEPLSAADLNQLRGVLDKARQRRR